MIKKLETMTKEETFKEKSAHYLHCFNSECPLHEQCLRWLVGQHTQCTAINIMCVNPMSPTVKAGQCEMYRENRIAKYACGMIHFYENIPSRQERNIKKRLILFFGRKRYYEYRNGTRPIPPQIQEEIARICREEGWTGALAYDDWKDDFLW